MSFSVINTSYIIWFLELILLYESNLSVKSKQPDRYYLNSSSYPCCFKLHYCSYTDNCCFISVFWIPQLSVVICNNKKKQEGQEKQEGQVFILDRIGESGEAVLVKGVVPGHVCSWEIPDMELLI